MLVLAWLESLCAVGLAGVAIWLFASEGEQGLFPGVLLLVFAAFVTGPDLRGVQPYEPGADSKYSGQ
jgi:hypothetical protein